MNRNTYIYYNILLSYYISNLVSRNYVDHPLRIIWVNPSTIKYARKRESRIVNDNSYTYVINGNWDIGCPLFEDISVAYKLYENEYIKKNKYKEIVINYINKYGIYYHGCKNEGDLSKKLKNNKKLYENIKNYGYYVPPGVKYGESGVSSQYTKEIKIAISRTGELIFLTGHHRLSVAKLLDIYIIPVQIAVRHKEWYDFKNKIIKERNVKKKIDIAGKYYKHPDIEYLLD